MGFAPPRGTLMKKPALLVLSIGLVLLPALALAQSKYIKEANSKYGEEAPPPKTTLTTAAAGTTTTEARTADATAAGRVEPAKADDGTDEDSATATDATGEPEADTATREGASTPQR